MPVKRKDRAKSSKDSTPYPDDKKSREEASSVSSQTDDEIFEAFNVAEDLGEKIEHVLLTLGKLDIIESRLQDINSTLASIERTVSRLDEEFKILKVKSNGADEVVKVLKENVEFNEEDISDLKRDSKEVQHNPASSGHLKYINNLLYKFLWDGKRDKIKRVEMVND